MFDNLNGYLYKHYFKTLEVVAGDPFSETNLQTRKYPSFPIVRKTSLQFFKKYKYTANS